MLHCIPSKRLAANCGHLATMNDAAELLVVTENQLILILQTKEPKTVLLRGLVQTPRRFSKSQIECRTSRHSNSGNDYFPHCIMLLINAWVALVGHPRLLVACRVDRLRIQPARHVLIVL